VYSTHRSLAIGRTVRNSSIYESRAKINPLEKQSHSTAGSAVAVRNYTNGVMGTADPSEIINDSRKHRSISSKRVSHGRNCCRTARTFKESNDSIIPLNDVSPSRFGSGLIPKNTHIPKSDHKFSRHASLSSCRMLVRRGAYNRLRDSADKLTRD